MRIRLPKLIQTALSALESCCAPQILQYSKDQHSGFITSCPYPVPGSMCPICSDDGLEDSSMSGILNLRSLGRICGSSNEMVVLDRVKRKNSVRRMSIIEDGELAEVLYLIPKHSMMEQLPFINPDDYILCEKLFSSADMAARRK
ncbi:hypothetical protein NQZ68_031699 [Dissostichus eleginoides]|nr:hypothetical protein NQZ68_031699 [Dissostichus eleginoides]